MPAKRTLRAVLEERLRDDLSEGWRLAVATTGCPQDALTAGERAQYARLAVAGHRRRTWLLGRQALRTLLTQLGEPPDTSALRFPHAQLSLSHSGGVAVATAADPAARGAGIDIEPFDLERLGGPSEALARFFLLPDEQAWLGEQPAPERPPHLLRLWTVKEAVFKANLANHGTGLHHYRLADCAAVQGTAGCVQQDAQFGYRTMHAHGLVVTTAIARGPL